MACMRTTSERVQVETLHPGDYYKLRWDSEYSQVSLVRIVDGGLNVYVVSRDGHGLTIYSGYGRPTPVDRLTSVAIG